MDRDKVIELVKSLGLTAEELGIQPEIKPDEMFVQNVKEFIEQYSSKEKAKEFFSDEYYELLGFEEEKKYKLVKLRLSKTIYTDIQVVMSTDESKDNAYDIGNNYSDFDYNLSNDCIDDEDYWEEDDVRAIADDLTRDEIMNNYDPDTIWNYEEMEEDC